MVTGRALTPITRLSLGGLLPHQQADRTRAPLEAPELYRESLYEKLEPSNIISPFGELFPTSRQITHVLLTRLPLSQKENHQPKFQKFKGIVRLAYLRHTANVNPEL